MLKTAFLCAAGMAIAGCTMMGVGSGQSVSGDIQADFTWTESGATRGTMIANLTDGELYQGTFFQMTEESQVTDYAPLWNGWGPGWGWGGGWGGRSWGWGWGGWGPWGPSDQTITHYSGQVLANLQGMNGFMRCTFTLEEPSSGMSGGGLGQCQLPTGTIIQAQFPRQ